MKKIKDFRVSAIACSVGLAFPSVSHAVLEEVVVTARKKVESLQEVPISVQAVTGEFITEQGIFDVQAMTLYTPNLNYATANGANDLLMSRGVGTIGAGVHFEPSVGQVFDGNFISRSRMGRSAFVDLAQVEVLKGPQGAIIGKNTSLGAILVTPRKPTEETEVKLTLGYSFENEEGYDAEAVVSGALSDSVRGRVVYQRKDQEGWTNNLSTDLTAPDRESDTFRGILSFDLTERLTGEVLYQYSEQERIGKYLDVIYCDGGASVEAEFAAGGVNCGRDASFSGVQSDNNGNPIDELFTAETDIASLRLDYEFTNGLVLTSQTAVTGYDVFDSFTFALSDNPNLGLWNDENYDQFSQEFRLSGQADRLNWVAGLYYLENELDFSQQVYAEVGPFNGFTQSRIARSETETTAVFGQVEWDATDDWTLTAGVRYTNEERDGFWTRFGTTDFESTDFAPASLSRADSCGRGLLTSTTQGNVDLGIDCNGVALTAFEDSFSDQNISFNLSAARQLNSGIVYVSYATGFKSGGFDFGGAPNPANFLFDEEETSNLELGGKHEFGDNIRFNWTLFRMEVDGLQLSSLLPSAPGTTPVQGINGADVTAQGVELELTWAVNDALTANWAVGYSDATFDSLFGTCPPVDIEGVCGVDLNGDGIEEAAQDQSGQSVPHAPDLSSVFSLDHVAAVGQGLELKSSFRWVYTGDYSTQIENSPLAEQESTNKIDLSVSLSGGKWMLALVGKNLTDELTYQFSSWGTNAAQAVGVTGTPQTLQAYPEQGRTFAIRLTYDL